MTFLIIILCGFFCFLFFLICFAAHAHTHTHTRSRFPPGPAGSTALLIQSGEGQRGRVHL